MTPLQPVHRVDDDELVGYLSAEPGETGPQWVARTLFGSALRSFDHRADAERFLQVDGLRLLNEKWWYPADETGDYQLTFLIEARLGQVRVRFGYDTTDPEVTLTGAQLDLLTLTVPR